MPTLSTRARGSTGCALWCARKSRMLLIFLSGFSGHEWPFWRQRHIAMAVIPRGGILQASLRSIRNKERSNFGSQIASVTTMQSHSTLLAE